MIVKLIWAGRGANVSSSYESFSSSVLFPLIWKSWHRHWNKDLSDYYGDIRYMSTLSLGFTVYWPGAETEAFIYGIRKSFAVEIASERERHRKKTETSLIRSSKYNNLHRKPISNDKSDRIRSVRRLYAFIQSGVFCPILSSLHLCCGCLSG